jgi:hypothetical protein
LVLRAYEQKFGNFDFQQLISAVRDADPEMALAAIDFWELFLIEQTVTFKDDFKKSILE